MVAVVLNELLGKAVSCLFAGAGILQTDELPPGLVETSPEMELQPARNIPLSRLLTSGEAPRLPSSGKCI